MLNQFCFFMRGLILLYKCDCIVQNYLYVISCMITNYYCLMDYCDCICCHCAINEHSWIIRSNKSIHVDQLLFMGRMTSHESCLQWGSVEFGESVLEWTAVWLCDKLGVEQAAGFFFLVAVWTCWDWFLVMQSTILTKLIFLRSWKIGDLKPVLIWSMCTQNCIRTLIFHHGDLRERLLS